MQGHNFNNAIAVTSLVTLAAALALCIPVAERLLAAIWQWYKFAGYSDDGHISLSIEAGLLFSTLLAVLFLSGLWLYQLAKRRAAVHAKHWSFMAVCTAVAAAAGYWLLGASSLNVWRP